MGFTGWTGSRGVLEPGTYGMDGMDRCHGISWKHRMDRMDRMDGTRWIDGRHRMYRVHGTNGIHGILGECWNPGTYGMDGMDRS